MVSIISRETIKPSSQSTQNLKPHKLCLIDQINRLTYGTCVLFFPNILTPESNFSSISEILTHLKKTLSETLNLYYPFSGRIKNDIYVDDFDAGVPFSEARVECRMSDYFKLNDPELLNELLPFPPYRKETNEPIPIPLLAFQANIFSCGGLALGLSLCHKLADGASMCYLYNSWAALCQGSHHEVLKPNLSHAAALFPPLDDFPQNISNLMDKICYQEGNYVTKKFFFSAEAVEAVREKARIDKHLPKPTRNEAVSCFIWKHVTEASWAVSGSRKGISVASHAVNMRGKLKFPNLIGNLSGSTTAVANTDEGEEGSMELPKLVSKLKEATEEYESALRSLTEKVYKEMGSGSELLLKNLEELPSLSEKLDTKPTYIRFSNWKSFINHVDFGWGKPFKVEAVGKLGAASNGVFLIDSQWGKGIEATLTLEDKVMAVLERDVNFLGFASSNDPAI